ncbi:dipeptide epimerase [Roseibium denhamense]|uniref:Dipeptide epimerase n=1 Tax=Roseibium denhamense TaxID=76305 RepID=A0ABY1N8W0_9HYPH|nr:N-acetyl-D-Glu racemase DgcA [Roseibium denhamense]MTI05632.1 dipeptide epimerase [Roseibium denhamense]SMP03364.1 L-alanine-DL-glutamate epimerase [Roseibium denhamense]
MSMDVLFEAEQFEIAGGFKISRETRTHAKVVVVQLEDGPFVGRGECVPYPRYGETVESVQTQIGEIAPRLREGLSRSALLEAMPAGAARNAVDCAMWDMEAKKAGTSAAGLAGLGALEPLTTAFTISVDTPEIMAQKTAAAAHRPLLKVKLGGAGDDLRIAAVRQAAPDSTLIVDANEAWDDTCFEANMAACEAAGVALIEQPLPSKADGMLAGLNTSVTICADESLHPGSGIDGLRAKYDAVNIKLDKAGGLTAALDLLEKAKADNFKIMIGCMLGTSLAMAPAVLLAQHADFVDLDGPLLLSQDRSPGLTFEGSILHPPRPELWG